MKLNSFLFPLGILFSLFSCKQKPITMPVSGSTHLSENYILGAFNHGTMTIQARFSECGEWGGHLENINVDIYKDMSVKARYQVYPYSCDSIDYYYTAKNLIPKVDKVVVLKEEGQKAINDYIQRLTQSKLKETFPGHAGNVFSLHNSDSTLVIQVYDNKEEDVNSYKLLVGELFH